MEPLYLENIPYRFDTRGIIFNKRNHIYKVNISNQKSSKIIDGDKEGFISIGSIVEKEVRFILQQAHTTNQVQCLMKKL